MYSGKIAVPPDGGGIVLSYLKRIDGVCIRLQNIFSVSQVLFVYKLNRSIGEINM
jgi:hypothetical protein